MEIKIESAVEQKEKKYGKFDEWEVKDALNTLKKAIEIKEDAELMDAIKKCAMKEVSAIKSIKDLRAKIQDDMDDEDEDY
jgi:hypothetical protein